MRLLEQRVPVGQEVPVGPLLLPVRHEELRAMEVLQPPLQHGPVALF